MSNDNLLTMMDEVFPNSGKLAMSIANFARGEIFEFMPTATYQQLLINKPQEAARVYWSEILYRAHLAAVTALARHARWISACLQHDGTEANYLGLPEVHVPISESYEPAGCFRQTRPS